MALDKRHGSSDDGSSTAACRLTIVDTRPKLSLMVHTAPRSSTFQARKMEEVEMTNMGEGVIGEMDAA